MCISSDFSGSGARGQASGRPAAAMEGIGFYLPWRLLPPQADRKGGREPRPPACDAVVLMQLLDLGLGDDVAIHRALAADALAVLGLALEAGLGEPLAHLDAGEDRERLLLQPGDDVRGRLRRREQG